MYTSQGLQHSWGLLWSGPSRRGEWPSRPLTGHLGGTWMEAIDKHGRPMMGRLEYDCSILVCVCGAKEEMMGFMDLLAGRGGGGGVLRSYGCIALE